jgi:hypothetical protein
MAGTATRWSNLVVSLNLLVAACSASEPASGGGKPNYQAYESVPVRSLWISVDKGATAPFHDRLERFAQRNSMAIWKSVTSPDQRNLSIAIQGDQLQIIAVNDAQLYEVAFYPGKAKRISEASLDNLISNMKSDLGSMDGVTFPTLAKRPSSPK